AFPLAGGGHAAQPFGRRDTGAGGPGDLLDHPLGARVVAPQAALRRLHVRWVSRVSAGVGTSVRVHDRIEAIGKTAWDACAGSDNPFLSYDFLEALEASGCVAPRTG